MALIDGILAYWNLNDDGSGGVSLVDSTGNGYTLTNPYPVPLGTGIIGGDAIFSGIYGQYLGPVTLGIQNSYSIGVWLKWSGALSENQNFYSSASDLGIQLSYFLSGNIGVANYGNAPETFNTGVAIPTDNAWHYLVFTQDSYGNFNFYLDGNLSYTNTFTPGSAIVGYPTGIGAESTDIMQTFNGQIDEVGTWSRALSSTEVSDLYNGGLGLTYPFISALYYNNAQNDGDWGNILNWWKNSGFTTQAVALPTATNPVNLYNQVTQNTQGANQCFCASASFWSANFGASLTLQASGVVNVQGTSIFAGTTTDGVSMHDSSQLAATSVVDGNVTMRDSSRAFGSILGNATIYYDGGNGQYPIGGTVGGSVTYLGWPAVSPQWFYDPNSLYPYLGDWSDPNNWWADNTYTTRPINAEGNQELPDASTDVFINDIAHGVASNTGSTPTVKSVTVNNSYIINISIAATDGFFFSGSASVGGSTLYGNVKFQDTAYAINTVMQGTATYKSAESLQNTWTWGSLGNLNGGATYGSTGFVVNISGGGGGGTALGTNWISRLLHLPWFINV